jgi:hypothetical protein
MMWRSHNQKVGGVMSRVADTQGEVSRNNAEFTQIQARSAGEPAAKMLGKGHICSFV